MGGRSVAEAPPARGLTDTIVRMGKKQKVKHVRIDISSRSGAKKLAGYKADGWEILSSKKRGALEWFPGQVDYVLTKNE